MHCTTCISHNETTQNEPFRSHTPSSFDWLDDLTDPNKFENLVEVKFKGTRSGFYYNKFQHPVKRNDVVVVSENGGHDLGVISFTGRMAHMQLNRKINGKPQKDLGIIHRKASPVDLQNWEQAKAREKEVMIIARKWTERLDLDMKVADVEFRGDGNKATFYYIANGRVDFRELIKVYAREFNIKVEMKQIGARQEAALVGGLGSCGRELCCSSWRTNFTTITTSMAQRQGLSANAEKLAGSCGKLKCCLMYELDSYFEAWSDFPEELLVLETKQGAIRPFKTNILERKVIYALPDEKSMGNVYLTIAEIKAIIQQNKRGIYPDIKKLTDYEGRPETHANMFNQNLSSNNKLMDKPKRTGNNNKRKQIRKPNVARTNL